MKKLVSFKHFVIALAMTFAGLATFSACQDKSFDFDNAHAINYHEKFTDTFIKEFGQPADGHQWGFDFNWAYNNTAATRSYSKIGNTEIIKPDNGDIEFNYIGIYGQVPDINEREHREVFDWFSTHQVNWGERTTRIVGDIYDSSYWFKLYDASNNLITPPDNAWTSSIAKVEKYDNHYVVKATAKVEEDWDNQFFIKSNRVLQAGEVTKLTFRAKATSAATIQTQCHAAPGTYIHWNAVGNVEFTTEWKKYEFDFTIPAECKGKDMQTIAFQLNTFDSANDYYFDNVSWECGSVQLVNNGNATTEDTSSFISKINRGGTESCSIEVEKISTLTGEFFLENTSGKVERGKIVKIEYFDEVHQTRYSGDDTTITAVKTRDLYYGNSIQPTGDTQVGLKINFTHAWLQRVADDNDFDSIEKLKKYQNDEIDVFGRANTSANISAMTYLEIFDLTNTHNHNNDFNAGVGYGYGTGTEKKTNNNYPGLEVYQNGELILGSNLNNLSIYNSNESHLHDKWIIVYLSGGKENDSEYGGKDTRYAGYYLAMDYEGGKLQDPTYQIGANGYCNDWIFKLTAVDPYKEKRVDCRIMCEDLGGEGNKVNITADRVLLSDIDYNDIVFDVTHRASNNVVDLTLRAAGGTLPLTVWYESTPLFETHEFFQKNAILKEDGHTTDVDYSIMYNTDRDRKLNNTKIGQSQPTFSLYFNDATGEGDEKNKYIKTGKNISDFNVGKLLIRVWRGEADGYKANPNSYSEAEWVNITNVNGQAPLKLCVPQSVDWLLEREQIGNGYPNFKDWVGDPTIQFWKKTVVQQYLYNTK